eukprot:CAMPEP_0118816676 /NCGR_PEP_ID=MMETSP1162-20130426/4927_1 /TAXON_ID=33656 /ORGANISM="Phaeocystis Sp, Strain CCMP2710" /LENGTH=253 /DNA_ID=CAMNT_0006746707 /DNA_START=130 /DNA_END=889 /DNA_ORIENTATION=+
MRYLLDHPAPCSQPATQRQWSALGLGLPGRQQVERAEFLRKLDGLCDHALLGLVVPALDEAREREVLAHWVALEAIVCEDAPQVGVAVEVDAIHVEGLALEPVGRAEELRDARHALIAHVAARERLDPDARVVVVAEQLVAHLEALLPRRDVHRSDVHELLAARARVVPQEAQHDGHVFGLDVHDRFAVCDYAGSHDSREHRFDALQDLLAGVNAGGFAAGGGAVVQRARRTTGIERMTPVLPKRLSMAMAPA